MLTEFSSHLEHNPRGHAMLLWLRGRHAIGPARNSWEVQRARIRYLFENQRSGCLEPALAAIGKAIDPGDGSDLGS